MLEDKIYKDFVDAMKSRDKARVEFLSFARSQLKQVAVDTRKEKLEDNEVLTILKSLKKRLEETKASVGTSGRSDIIEKAELELAFVSEYLPAPLSDAELTALIDLIISETGAASIKDMGKVMKEISARAGVRADAKKASDQVRSKLSPAK